jgi:hypothetical protein
MLIQFFIEKEHTTWHVKYKNNLISDNSEIFEDALEYAFNKVSEYGKVINHSVCMFSTNTQHGIPSSYDCSFIVEISEYNKQNLKNELLT